MKQLILRSLLWALLWSVCLCSSYTFLYGQTSYVPQQIFKAYEAGYHQSVRDAFSLLQQPTDNEILQQVTKSLFLDMQDPALRELNPKEWLAYYYQHQDQIEFYPQWKSYLRNDLPIPNLPYAILEDYGDNSIYIEKARAIYNFIKNKPLKKALPLIESLSLPEIFYSDRILLDCLELLSASYSCEKITTIYAAISSRLLILNDQFIHQKIHSSILAKNCGEQIFNTILSKISQNKVGSVLYKNIAVDLETYRNSQFIAHLKDQHFSKSFGISSTYFEDKADYYGKLLHAVDQGNTTDEDEIINLLLKSESSKALYYLVSKWYTYAISDHPRAKELMYMLTSFIDSNVQVNTPDGRAFKCNTSSTDQMAKKSILAFWINNHSHYEWNEDVNKFVNKNILKKDRQELVQLYKNLNNKNSEYALKSYWKLINSDPILLAEVDKIYSKKLLNYNRDLPSRKYKYLLQISRLVQYCKSNGIDYRVDKRLQPSLTDLKAADNISEIIKIENQIIELLDNTNITAFEIWAVVNSGTEHIKYSTTRISNIYYNRNLDKIITSTSDLNLFLKKSTLFKKFGDHGSSKYYLKKIVDNKNINVSFLKDLKNKNIDEDILSSVDYIINYKNRKDKSSKDIDFDDFLKSPVSFESSTLDHISKPNKKGLNKLLLNFEEKYTLEESFIVLEWINIHAPKELLPFILSLQSSQNIVKSRQDIEVPIKDFADQILSTYISKDSWSSTSWPKEYTKVFKNLFDKNLKEVSIANETSIETINDILNSKFYTADLRSIIIEALAKVKPARNIISCNLDKKLSVEELKFLQPKIHSKNGLDYLLKITDVENNDKVVAFLVNLIREKGVIAAGKFFNGLFKMPWFTEYIDSEHTSSDIKLDIQWILTNYWENEDGMSSFEEEQTVLNIIKIELAGKSLTERIDLILASFVDNDVKLQTIKKIIVQIDYKSISTLLNYYDQIVEIGGLELYNFINNDFGIPVEDISNREIINQLSSDLINLSEKDLYHKYLKMIGVDLFNSNMEFDINKAYRIITEDLVRPFVGTGGSVRDIYVFGTIKVLEKEFSKTLGFHPKLNESQSFYKYTAKKRTLAWSEELSRIIQNAL